ncbi:high affinity methionine permease, partial [Amanita muscaria]
IETASAVGDPSFEDATVAVGAPTETISPLGYHVGAVTVVFLNISRMIGTGIFSTPGSILVGVGSPGLSLIFWVIGFVFAATYLCVYLEYASYFPNRSGAEVAYLEKAYPRPRYLIPTAFAVLSVVLSFSSSNAIVLAEYILAAAAIQATTWRIRGLAVGVYTGIILICWLNTKWSLRLSNLLGLVKLLTLVFVSITGLVVLGGHTAVKDPHANFRNAFAGTSQSVNGIANALVKVNFAYSGYENAFNVLNEVKNPVKTMKRYAPLSLTIVFVLYFMCNIAYFAAGKLTLYRTVPQAQIRTSKELTASLFFKAVFGNQSALTALDSLIAISTFGNLISIVIGMSRVIRECGRQGVLPFPEFWASTRPFNTPSGPLLLKWVLTTIVIIAPPTGDAFNFIVDLQQYPYNLFSFLMTLGLFFVRKRRQAIGAHPSEFRAWNAVLAFCLLVNVYLLIMPWVPPAGGIYGGDVSFFYATYCVVGLAILLLCGIAYVIWIVVLPHFGGYEIRQTVGRLSGGAQTTKLVKIPKDKIAEWDATHDEHGEPIN